MDGLSVVVFSDAASAIDYLKVLPITVVIMEYYLPDIKAVDLIEMIRTDLGLVQLPFVVFTNQDSFETKRSIEAYNNCELVIKKAVSAAAFSKKIQAKIIR